MDFSSIISPETRGYWPLSDRETHNDHEKKLMEIITTCYTSKINKTLDPLLVVDPTSKKYTPIGTIKFNVNYNQISHVNELYTNIHGAVAKICKFQTATYGTWDKCYLNTPTALFLEENKNWLCHVSGKQIDKQLQIEVKNRESYLDSIMMRRAFGQEFCKLVKETKTSITQMSIEIGKIIRQQVAMTYISYLESSTSEIVQQSLIILYHIFNNTHDASNTSLAEIYKQSMDSSISLNKVVYPLLQLNEVKNNFSSMHLLVENTKNSVKTISTVKNSEELVCENKFLTKEGKEQISLVELLLKDKGQSGIEEVFQQEKCLKPLVKAFGLVLTLNRYCIALKEIKDLAGKGGEILLYGVMGGFILEQIKAQHALTKELKTILAELYRYSEFFADYNIDKPIKLSEVWIQNHLELKEKKEIIEKAFEKNNDHMNAIDIAIKEFMKNPQQAVEDLKKKFVDYEKKFYLPLIEQTKNIIQINPKESLLSIDNQIKQNLVSNKTVESKTMEIPVIKQVQQLTQISIGDSSNIHLNRVQERVKKLIAHIYPFEN